MENCVANLLDLLVDRIMIVMAHKKRPESPSVGKGVNVNRSVVAAVSASMSLALIPFVAFAQGNDSSTILSIDHYVPVVSTVPSIAGEMAQIYVRERALARTDLQTRSLEDRVVLFVHGAGTPGEVAFDVPYEGYSWMAFLAAAGFDVFSMDMTGYGRSTRPLVMNDPCNLAKQQQAEFVPVLIGAPCSPRYDYAATTIASDWNDLNAVVEYLLELRDVDRVSLIGWSLGGPRAGGYAARYPEKVRSIVLLSPAYSRGRPSESPESLPVPGAAMTKQSQRDFRANWDRQVGCADQYDPAVGDAVWSAMLASDPVGASWGTGVRRAPRTTTWGWDPDRVRSTSIPMLLFAPAHDGQVAPERVAELYEDLGSSRKVLIDLACASHNAMWERNRMLLYDASLQWLRDGVVKGVDSGELRLGY